MRTDCCIQGSYCAKNGKVGCVKSIVNCIVEHILKIIYKCEKLFATVLIIDSLQVKKISTKILILYKQKKIETERLEGEIVICYLCDVNVYKEF